MAREGLAQMQRPDGNKRGARQLPRGRIHLYLLIFIKQHSLQLMFGAQFTIDVYFIHMVIIIM